MLKQRHKAYFHICAVYYISKGLYGLLHVLHKTNAAHTGTNGLIIRRQLSRNYQS